MFRQSTAIALAITLITGCNSPDKERAKGTPPTSGGTSDTKVDAKPGGAKDAGAEREIVVKEELYADGKLASRVEGYVDENGEFVRHGERATWYERGQKKMEMHYADGLAHGPRLTWYDTGQMWARGAYVNGREDGTWTAWYPNGFRFREWHLRQGMWHGTYTEYHENGEIRFQVEYVEGLKQGSAVWYDEAGNEVQRVDFVDDVQQPAASGS